MTDTSTTKVTDSIAKVDDELAVGEDLEFQRKWWRFERWVWRFLALLVLCDLLGIFGRGPLAHAHAATSDHALTMQYDRIERFSTPSILDLQLGNNAVHNGEIRLWVGNSLVERLGNQSISPEPASTTTTSDGLLYTFPSQNGGKIRFALQPGKVGLSHLTIALASATGARQPADELHVSIFVMP